jgi:predicted transcriptional regulator
MNKLMKSIKQTYKTFIFQYNPHFSPKKMFEHFKEAVETGKKHIQPKNLLVSNSLEAIYRSITPARLEIFTCLLEKKPHNITELASLLKRDYANVHKDLRALESLEIVKLKKEGKETRPVALYEKITLDFSSLKKPVLPPTVSISS